MTRELLWVSLPDQRARREVYWMSRMPQTHVTALAREAPDGEITWVPTTYTRPIKRFIEAGAFAWARGVGFFAVQKLMPRSVRRHAGDDAIRARSMNAFDTESA